MKSMMMKSTLREIKQSLGRYLAILAIVALGVGFFAGLKATKPAMLQTGDLYLAEKQFYDFRLICTLGFDDKIVEEINRRQDVRTVQGAYSFDILCQSSSDGSANVIKAYSITEDINELEVLHGRLPKNADECVVDSRLFSKKYIGKKLKLAESNAAEDLENFAYKEYKIVGIVNSPLYIQFERGNSSIGSGKVSGFMYLLPEGFDSDAYTELYVKLTEDFELYSEEYDAYIESKEPEWEAFLEELGALRYDNIIVEANEKLADAKQELADAKAEAETELADAKKELDDAGIEIADGKQQIADAKQELADGLAEIEKQEKKLADAEKTIAKNEKLLAQKEKELEQGIVDWQAGKNTLNANKTQLAEGESQLTTQESQLLAGEQQLAASEAELISGEEQLASMEKLVTDGLAEIEKQEKDIAAREKEWLDSMGFVPEVIQEQLNTERELLLVTKDALLKSKAELDTNRKKLEDGRRQLNAAKAQINSGKQQIADAKQQLADGKTQLTDGENQLNTSWETIKEGRKQINDGKLELIKGKQELEEGKKALEDGRKELEEGQAELAEKEQELLDGEKEYLDGLQEYEDALAEFEAEIADAEAEIAEAEADLKDIEAPEQYLLGRDTNVGYVMFESDSDIVENVSTVFPVFFFMVAALVCMTTMSRMIEEQRTQIGTLKALGYSKSTIMGKYIFYSGSAALIGCVGGFLIGILLFPFVIWFCYGMMYDMGGIHFLFDWKMAVVALAVSLLCSVGTTWYSCRKELNEVAAQLMRPKTPQAGKRILLERIPFIWKRLKFLQKVSIRNVFRYKKRFFMMVIGISGCGALVLAAFGLKDSIASVLIKQYGSIFLNDMSVTLKDGFDQESQESFEECLGNSLEKYGVVLETSVDYQSASGAKAVYLVTAMEHESLSDFVNMHTQKGDSIALPGKGEGVITHKLAKEYNISVGDTLEFQDEDYHTIRITVSGIMENFVYNYVYIHPETYREQIGEEAEYRTIYLNVTEDTDMHLLSAALMKLDGVTAVSINEDIKVRFESMMTSLDYIVLLVLGCAAALAFIVIYNLTNINITERVREIATIKVLGFYKKETSTYVFRENILLTFVGAMVGLVIGVVLHRFIMDCIKIDMVTFDVHINPISYVYSVGLTMFFALCVNKLMAKKPERISMTESLKSVD